VMTSTPLAPLPAMAAPDPARPRPPYRFIGTLALLGAALLTGGTVLHPAHADPGSPTAAVRTRGLAEAAEPQPEPQRNLDSCERSRISRDVAPRFTCTNGTRADIHERAEFVWASRGRKA
jgi:hypothetical protein